METNKNELPGIVQDIVDLTKELIRFKSTHSRPDEILACARFIETWLGENDIPCTVTLRNDVPSICALPAHQSAPLLLMSHIDVVEGDDCMFEPVEKKGRLYGRGAIDDKYAAALSMVLLKQRMTTGSGISPLGLLITGDEEVGGANGALAALDGMDCDFCIALDGGRVDKIVVKEKGVLQLKIVAGGKAAHGARPWKGENAIEKLMDDCRIVKGFFKGLTDPQHWHRTANLSMFSAGKSPNQVPDRAEAVFDIRFTENDDVDSLIRDIEEKVSGAVVVNVREPLFIGTESPYLERLLTLAEGTKTGIAHGASDARFLSQYGIDGIVWGANGNGSQHTADEHVEIESIAQLYGILDRFVTDIMVAPI